MRLGGSLALPVSAGWNFFTATGAGGERAAAEQLGRFAASHLLE